MADIRKLLEAMDKFAGEPSQKPGEQWRGDDAGTPGNKLVGEEEQQESERFLGEPYIRETDEDTEDCPACSGSGTEYGETCVRCGGKGYLKNGEYVDEAVVRDEFDDFLDSMSDEEMYAYDQEDRHQGKSDKQLGLKLHHRATIDDEPISEGRGNSVQNGDIVQLRRGPYYRPGYFRVDTEDAVGATQERPWIGNLESGSGWYVEADYLDVVLSSDEYDTRSIFTPDEVEYHIEERNDINEAPELTDLERNKAVAAAKLDDPTSGTHRAIWLNHYRRAISMGKADREARYYADTMTRSEPSLRKSKSNESAEINLDESEEQIAEALKAAFEDYVSNEKYDVDTLYPKKNQKPSADKKKVKAPKVVDPATVNEDANTKAAEIKDEIAAIRKKLSMPKVKYKESMRQHIRQLEKELKTLEKQGVTEAASHLSNDEEMKKLKEFLRNAMLMDDKEEVSRIRMEIRKLKGEMELRAQNNPNKKKVSESKEFCWTDYDHIPSMEDRLLIAETYFTKNTNLTESNDKSEKDYFDALVQMSDIPSPGNKYICTVLGLVNNRLVSMQSTTIATFINEVNDGYKLKFEDGSVRTFPPLHTGSKMTVATFFFADNNAFEKFKTAASLKFNHKFDSSTKFDESKKVPGIKLQFKTKVVTESTDFRKAMRSRFNELYENKLINDYETPFRKMSPNCSKKVNESEYHDEIKPFIDAITTLDLGPNSTIKVGQSLAVLDFEIMFAFQEVVVRGFATPKEIADIQTYPDKKIKKIIFTDGDHYPRQMPVAYGGRPISYSAFFKSEDSANAARSHLNLLLPTNWTMQFELNEAKISAGNKLLNRMRINDLHHGRDPEAYKKLQTRVDTLKNQVADLKTKSSTKKDAALGEGHWNDAVQATLASRQKNKDKPFEKNPLSHDEQGTYVGDKDLAGNVVPKIDKKEKMQTLMQKMSDIQSKLAVIKSRNAHNPLNNIAGDVDHVDEDLTTQQNQQGQKPLVPGQQPTAQTAQPITSPKTTAQQPPAPAGTQTAVAAPGQPQPPAAGQAGGAPVAAPAGTPAAPTGTAANSTTTPIQSLAAGLQQLTQPGSQVAAKKAADALARIK